MNSVTHWDNLRLTHHLLKLGRTNFLLTWLAVGGKCYFHLSQVILKAWCLGRVVQLSDIVQDRE